MTKDVARTPRAPIHFGSLQKVGSALDSQTGGMSDRDRNHAGAKDRSKGKTRWQIQFQWRS
jgi:hypothetical protein